MPSLAFAADPAHPVQPVPYTPSQPVPYAVAPTPPPLPAPAPVNVTNAVGATGDDVVVLKDGGMIRGTLLEVIPNDHATVQLATGQSARVQWDHIERIERGAAAAPRVAAPEGAPVARRAAPSARVHIESDRPATLERHEGAKAWVAACSAPCDADLPLDAEYRIVGDGIRKSSPFRLAANDGGRVTLDVNAATKGGFAGGIVLTSLGPIVMLVGAVVVAIGEADKSLQTDFNGSGSTSSSGSSTITTGWVTVAVGAVATVGGILMIAGNSRSSVAQSRDDGRRDSARADAWKRLPTWHEEANALASPKTALVPLFTGKF